MTQHHGFGASLVGLAVLIQRRHAQICAEHDLTPAQAQLLCMIKDRPRGMTELAQLMGLAKPGLSGLVDRAERRGLVRRNTPERDRRAVTLSTTPLGKEAVDALFADVSDRLPDILEGLSAQDRHVFEHLVNAVVATSGGPPLLGGRAEVATMACGDC
ncbi:MarR family winged helix-turn-helix transcriptional regulator [Actinoplanes sp. ATCC 53533]|uniref:MarR family winged helix-turn-helix transcriptional regulator n=1 Tax=Actinoplanes sp. ATCC 53533 TaxID=1288362 RepID=UPI001F2F19D6|nr:MarR family transcriptional regulator [Actinoplanes sp. ATCC 53533]